LEGVFILNQRKNNQKEQPGKKKKGWLNRFMERLSQANKEYPGTIS